MNDSCVVLYSKIGWPMSAFGSRTDVLRTRTNDCRFGAFKKLCFNLSERERTNRHRVLRLGKGSTDAGVMLMRSYFWHQAQLCMALARGANDPVLKQRYEDLALDLTENAGSERDLDMTVPP